MKIRVDIFKTSGKWYTDEFIEILDGTLGFMIPDEVAKNRRIKEMITVSMRCKENEDLELVPFLIPADEVK